MRLASVAALALLSFVLSGCYVYRPLYTAPTPGLRVVVDINDRGRIALEQNIGPDAASIEGTLREASDSLLLISVTEVRTLYRSTVRWNGETVSVRTGYVRLMRERAYSRPHTLALVTALASSTVAFIATRGLIGLGGSADRPSPGGPDTPPPEN